MSNDPNTVHYDENEISLVDVIRFFQRQWRLIGGVTIAIATAITAATVAISITRPPSYARSVTLQVKDPFLLLGVLGRSSNADSPPQIAVVDALGNWTSTTLSKLKLDVAVQGSTYDIAANQLTFELAASNPEQLKAIPTTLVLEGLAEQWQVPLQQALSDHARQFEVQEQKVQTVLSQLETAIAQLPADDASRQEALEGQRALMLREQAELMFQTNHLAELENNLEQASRDLFPVAIAAESNVTRIKQSPIQVIVLAPIAGFMVATLVALMVEQWPRWQAELAMANMSESE